MKRLVKAANLISLGMSASFIIVAVYIIYIQNRMIRDTIRLEPVVKPHGVKIVINQHRKELKKVKYYNLQLELENTVYKQQINENKIILKNYRKYVVDSLRVKGAVYGVQ